ncbi:MAG TPA: excinuclease ABC subunit UvrC [Opitutales bacterium]|nr:excinuclease ABC subunit UvrC [Opitutales bacterium]
MKEKLRRLPQTAGVYLMKDRLGGILYVGKARNLKKRVTTYFQPSRRQKLQQPKVAAMLDLIEDFETIEVRSEAEALLLESRLIKHWKPRYNTMLTDDKRYPMIRVDVEGVLPRFRVTRLRTSEASRYFGPFAFAVQMRKTLLNMRLRFGVLLADASPTPLPDGRWKLYDDIRSELYGHANIVSAAEYRERVDRAIEFLEGESRNWMETILSEMSEASANRDYEKAAELRDLAAAIEKTLIPTRKFANLPQTEMGGDAILEQLREALGMKQPPHTIECFDISHISGTFCVASMVRFTGGRPDNRAYRRFRIKSFLGNDDFRAMEEVVGRRYCRLRDEGSPMPDLLVVDGGLGQVASALRAFAEAEIEPPFLIGLAKKHERVFFADGRPFLDLPADSESRKLLQRLRDEAHRFANTYNADLRSRKIRESVLDDFPGMGPVRKKALLDRFGSIERLRAAGASELAEVEGIGPKLAEELEKFLRET